MNLATVTAEGIIGQQLKNADFSRVSMKTELDTWASKNSGNPVTSRSPGMAPESPHHSAPAPPALPQPLPSHLLIRSSAYGLLPSWSLFTLASTLPSGMAPQPVLTGARRRWEVTKGEGQTFNVTYLPFQVSGFIRRGSWEDSGVTEAGTKQGPHHKEEQDATNHRDGGGDLHC